MFQRIEQTKAGDPRWAVYWRDSGGSQRKQRFSDPKEAARFMKLKEADAIRGTPEPSRMRFEALWSRWKEEAFSGLTPKTVETYRGMGERLLLPFFGRMPVAEVTRQVVSRWIKWATGEAGAGSVEKAFTTLSSALGYALDLGLIPANPCARMGKYLPKVAERRKRPHLTSDKVQELAGEVDPTFRAIILSMGVLGLRPGEAIALRLGDVDLERGELHVRRSAVDVGTEMVERDMTKSGRERTIPLMGTEDAFRRHLAGMYGDPYGPGKYGDLYGPGPQCTPDPDDLLTSSRFSAPGRARQPGDPRPLIKTAALAKLVRRAGERIGVPGLSADDLRHAAAANIVELTGDLAFAQYVLGHTARTMTLEHYDQGTPVRWGRAIEAVSAAYAGGTAA